jgi:DNA transformation protein and related proteins
MASTTRPTPRSTPRPKGLPAMVSHALELLAECGVPRARAMFGGHGLYLDGVFMALVADEVLYLKVDAQTQARFAEAGSRPFTYTGGERPMVMSYWTVPDDALDSASAFAPWARLALAAGLRTRAATARPAQSAPVTPRRARSR